MKATCLDHRCCHNFIVVSVEYQKMFDPKTLTKSSVVAVNMFLRVAFSCTHIVTFGILIWR